MNICLYTIRKMLFFILTEMLRHPQELRLQILPTLFLQECGVCFGIGTVSSHNSVLANTHNTTPQSIGERQCFTTKWTRFCVLCQGFLRAAVPKRNAEVLSAGSKQKVCHGQRQQQQPAFCAPRGKRTLARRNRFFANAGNGILCAVPCVEWEKCGTALVEWGK